MNCAHPSFQGQRFGLPCKAAPSSSWRSPEPGLTIQSNALTIQSNIIKPFYETTFSTQIQHSNTHDLRHHDDGDRSAATCGKPLVGTHRVAVFQHCFLRRMCLDALRNSCYGREEMGARHSRRWASCRWPLRLLHHFPRHEIPSPLGCFHAAIPT